MGKIYDSAKKKEAIKRVIENNEKQTKVAKDLDIPLQTVNYWVNTHKSGKDVVNKKRSNAPLARITFGRILTRLRYQSTALGGTLSSNSFARRIGIGGSSLRMLESGYHLPPTKIAYKLSLEMKLSLPRLIILIGMVRFIDEGYDISESLEACKAFGKIDSALGYFVEILSEASLTDQKERRSILKSDELTNKLLEFIRFDPDEISHNKNGSDQIIHLTVSISKEDLASLLNPKK